MQKCPLQSVSTCKTIVQRVTLCTINILYSFDVSVRQQLSLMEIKTVNSPPDDVKCLTLFKSFQFPVL